MRHLKAVKLWEREIKSGRNVCCSPTRNTRLFQVSAPYRLKLCTSWWLTTWICVSVSGAQCCSETFSRRRSVRRTWVRTSVSIDGGFRWSLVKAALLSQESDGRSRHGDETSAGLKCWVFVVCRLSFLQWGCSDVQCVHVSTWSWGGITKQRQRPKQTWRLVSVSSV